ncbi:glycosyltransferase family 8 protein, partial [Lepidopterella palustris CBS 459.81]
AYATLLTKPSQLPGVILLGHTIHLYSPIHPLIVLYTPSTISKECLTALRSESIYSNLTLHDVERLVPPHTDMQHVDDSWTKLRVFELHWLCYTKICFLDASILVRHDPELIFWAEIPENDGLVATHTCVCGLDHDASAPKSWMPENCAYNGLTHPSALSFSSNISRSSRPEHHILASGVFMFAPRRELYESLFRTLASTSAEEIAACTTSDPVGVFLSRFFVGRWKGVGYQFNAVTKMRRWHPDMWDDWSVCCLNYNAENPWTKRVAGDGIVEMEGKDNVTATHGWWWDEHTKWEAKR